MISLGDGNWQDVLTTRITPNDFTDIAFRVDLRVADLDGDGKQHLVFVNAVGGSQLVTMVVWNRYPNFVQTTTTGLFLTGKDTSRWQLTDIDGDDNRELVRMSGDLDVIRIPVPDVRVSRAENGMGAVDDIVYGTITEVDRDMPLGFIPHVVRTVGEKSRSGAGNYDALFSYSYGRATYSRGGAILQSAQDRSRPPAPT